MARAQIFGALVAALIVVAAAGGYAVGHAARRPTPTPKPVTQVKGDVSADEACLATAVNTDRAAAGLPALPVDPTLSNYSRSHSAEMATAGATFHSGGSPTNQIPTDAQFRAALPQPYRGAAVAGENVGNDSADDCAGMNTAYMNSPEHRPNILDHRWTAMGIGVAFDANGGLYTTEDFVDIPAAPPAPIPKAAPPVVPLPAVSPRPPVGCGA